MTLFLKRAKSFQRGLKAIILILFSDSARMETMIRPTKRYFSCLFSRENIKSRVEIAYLRAFARETPGLRRGGRPGPEIGLFCANPRLATGIAYEFIEPATKGRSALPASDATLASSSFRPDLIASKEAPGSIENAAPLIRLVWINFRF